MLGVAKNPDPKGAGSAALVVGTLKATDAIVSVLSKGFSVSKMDSKLSARRLSISRSLSNASMLEMVGFRDSGRRSETEIHKYIFNFFTRDHLNEKSN